MGQPTTIEVRRQEARGKRQEAEGRRQKAGGRRQKNKFFVKLSL